MFKKFTDKVVYEVDGHAEVLASIPKKGLAYIGVYMLLAVAFPFLPVILTVVMIGWFIFLASKLIPAMIRGELQDYTPPSVEEVREYRKENPELSLVECIGKLEKDRMALVERNIAVSQ